ncbi:MAG: peptide chain release factor-like protein [Christensenellales bacterium]
MREINEIKNKLEEINKEYFRLCELLTYEEILLDKKLFLQLEKQKQSLQPIVLKFEEYLQLNNNLQELIELIPQVDNKDKNIFEEELSSLTSNINQVSEELFKLVTNLNAIVGNIVVEIVANKNNISQELLNILVDSYSNFCKNNSLTCVNTQLDNYANRLSISGLNAKELFINESGMHIIEKSLEKGSCTVFILDDIFDDFQIEDKDISIVSSRSSGAGGQHINTTDSAIKATHLKTGISVICQDERSQLQNKVKAIENLKNKVKNFYENQRDKKIEESKRRQLKAMQNSRYIKLYNLDKNSVSKADKTTISIDDFLKGKAL